MDHNALRSWHATMYKFVTSMVRCGLGMPLNTIKHTYATMHNATIHKTTIFVGVCAGHCTRTQQRHIPANIEIGLGDT